MREVATEEQCEVDTLQLLRLGLQPCLLTLVTIEEWVGLPVGQACSNAAKAQPPKRPATPLASCPTTTSSSCSCSCPCSLSFLGTWAQGAQGLA